MAKPIDYRNLKPHPAAMLFPAYSEEELIDLAQDIAANGLHNPIVLHEGQILDGMNRYKVCLAADDLSLNSPGSSRPFADSMFTEYQGSDPVGFVISMNLKRRHLTTAQRGQIASELANKKSGTRTDLESNDTRSVEEAAKLMNVSPGTVKRATAIRKAKPGVGRGNQAGEENEGGRDEGSGCEEAIAAADAIRSQAKQKSAGG